MTDSARDHNRERRDDAGDAGRDVVAACTTEQPASGDVDLVWVATRHGRRSTLILGAFATADMARAYCDRYERRALSTWHPPQPGRRYWRTSCDDYELRIDGWPVKSLSDLPLHLAGALRDEPDDTGRLGEVIAKVHRTNGRGELEITLIREQSGQYVLRGTAQAHAGETSNGTSCQSTMRIVTMPTSSGWSAPIRHSPTVSRNGINPRTCVWLNQPTRGRPHRANVRAHRFGFRARLFAIDTLLA